MDVEGRLHSVETELAKQGTELGHLKSSLAKVGSGVEQLLEANARRPSPVGLTTIAATLAAAAGTMAGIGTFVWWIIATSPTVQDLDRRLTRLDDPETGRVSRLLDLPWSHTARK
jgi:hypothetical protein